jgi:hypothetical protein
MAKVRPGQPWKPERALDANAKSTAADFHRRSNQNIDGQRDRSFEVDSNIVYIRNESAEDTDRGDVLALLNTTENYQEKLLTKCDREKMWLAADLFASDTLEATPVLCVDPIPAGKIGPAQVAGAGVALVNVGNVNHTHAEPTAGELYLSSGTSGLIRLLHKPDATGEQLCIVLFQATAAESEVRRCCLAENHPGCGVVFDLKLGTHNTATDDWDYEATASAHGIDHWYSVAGPYPPAGATGWFRAYPSDTYGTLWHGWDISCDDDACGTCAEPA